MTLRPSAPHLVSAPAPAAGAGAGAGATVRSGREPRRGRRAARATLTLLVLAVPVLAGCSQAVGVAVAPHATDPACASIVLALPDTLADLDRSRTTSQATAAWGSGTDAVTLRCGVDVPGPTTEQCVTVETPSGPSVDWIVTADAEAADATLPGTDASTGGSTGAATTGAPLEEPTTGADSDWTFVTYGRDPAVEVHVPASVVAERSASFLDALGVAVSRVEATRSCV
ncbi:MAG TPA: DUF3515 family protein [Cellulomonas sp.]